MKVQAGVLFGSQAALAALIATTLPFKASYAVSRAVRKCADELKHFEEKRSELVKQHGVQEADGGYRVLPDKMPEYVKSFNDICGVEITIGDVDPIDVALFGDTPVKAEVLMQLHWLLA